MMQLMKPAAIAAAVFNHVAEARSYDSSDLTVRIRGGVVHGAVDSSTPDVRQFLGIPYAQPPVRDLRFAPPQPALPFGELDAKDLPPSCMQYLSSLPSIITEDVLEFNLGGLYSTAGLAGGGGRARGGGAPRRG